MIYLDLVLDTGELVRVECPNKHEDEMHETMQHAMKRRDVWSPGMFDGCKAGYLGMGLDQVNMARVVGLL